jgi:hypothetical protein
MKNYTVTDEMVDAAVKQYVVVMPFKDVVPTYKAMRSAINVALELSGLQEEIDELKLALENAAVHLESTALHHRIEGDSYKENIFLTWSAETRQALNKEHYD